MSIRTLILSIALLLSLLALSPWQPQGPFDARTWQPLEGVSLALPLWGQLLEPLFAPGHIIMGAPDFRLAAASILLWLLLLSFVVVLWRGLRNTAVTGRGRRLTLALLQASGATVMAFGLFLLYLLSAAMLNFPGWQLTVEGDERVVADLQTHTLGSHDAFVTAEENLAWHRKRGYDLIAVTEHWVPDGGFLTRQLAEAKPDNTVAVIPSVEINSEYEEYLLGLGLDAAIPVLPWKGNEADYTRDFIDAIHHQHNGAVIAMAWKLPPERVMALAEAGVDAFEIANTGHPDIPLEVRAQMLAAAEQHGVILLASTDWHGWSGFTRTWTLVEVSDAEQLSLRERADAVVALLKQREAGAFVPVTAGYIGPPEMWRLVFAPLAELARYAAELSPLRLLVWWLWGALLWWLAVLLRQRQRRPLWIYGGLVAGGFATALLMRGMALLAIVPGGAVLSEDTGMWGERAALLGGLGLVFALLALWRGWARR